MFFYEPYSSRFSRKSLIDLCHPSVPYGKLNPPNLDGNRPRFKSSLRRSAAAFFANGFPSWRVVCTAAYSTEKSADNNGRPIFIREHEVYLLLLCVPLYFVKLPFSTTTGKIINKKKKENKKIIIIINVLFCSHTFCIKLQGCGDGILHDFIHRYRRRRQRRDHYYCVVWGWYTHAAVTSFPLLFCKKRIIMSCPQNVVIVLSRTPSIVHREPHRVIALL